MPRACAIRVERQIIRQSCFVDRLGKPRAKVDRVECRPAGACDPATGKQWLSFNVRKDLLRGLTIGSTVPVARSGVSETTEAVVTLAGAARHVRHLAGRACGGRPQSQYAAVTPRSARRCERTRTRNDGLAAAPINGLSLGAVILRFYFSTLPIVLPFMFICD